MYDRGSQNEAPEKGAESSYPPRRQREDQGRRINSEILAASSRQEICGLVEKYLGTSDFNNINAVTATYRISKVGNPQFCS